MSTLFPRFATVSWGADSSFKHPAGAWEESRCHVVWRWRIGRWLHWGWEQIRARVLLCCPEAHPAVIVGGCAASASSLGQHGTPSECGELHTSARGPQTGPSEAWSPASARECCAAGCRRVARASHALLVAFSASMGRVFARVASLALVWSSLLWSRSCQEWEFESRA